MSKVIINQEKLEEVDSHWEEVMKLAEKYGFIHYAYAGTAILATHKNEIKTIGEKKHISKLRSLKKLHLITDIIESGDNG